MKTIHASSPLIAAALAGTASPLHAASCISASYTLTIDTTDAGGTRATSASYTYDGSTGGIAGISTVATPAETAKNGYLGQLTEVTALLLAASPTTVNETTTRQLGASQLFDDLTTAAVPAASIAWSVQGGKNRCQNRCHTPYVPRRLSFSFFYWCHTPSLTSVWI